MHNCISRRHLALQSLIVLTLFVTLAGCAAPPHVASASVFQAYGVAGTEIAIDLPYPSSAHTIVLDPANESGVKYYFDNISVADFGLTTGKRSISSIMIFLTEMSFDETVAYHNSKLKPSSFWWMPQDEAKAKEVLPNGFLTGIRPRHPFRRRIEFGEWYYIERCFIFELSDGRTLSLFINTSRAVAGRDETHYIRHADEIFERVHKSIRTTAGERIYKPVD